MGNNHCPYGGNYNLPTGRSRPRLREFVDFDPVFDDIPTDAERKELAGERDGRVLRISHYMGFVIKKYRPYNHWLVVFREDRSATPPELAGAYTEEKEAKQAIREYMEKNNNESTTD